MALKDFLTPKNPLGPFRHERILKRSDEEGTNILIYRVEAFDHILGEQRPIIIGRRGAGKTTIVAALLARSGRDEYFYTRSASANTGKDIYVFVNSWDHLDELVDRVGKDAAHSLGPDGDWSSLLPETAARHWKRRIWGVIFQQIFRDSVTNRQLRAKLPLVTKFIQGRDIISNNQEITDEALNNAFSQVRGEVISFLKNEKRQCFVVIDSLEHYPVTAPRFQKLIAGMLKCVNDFNDDFPEVHVLCCIPEEIEPFITPRSSNRLKDLSTTSSVSRLRWRPVDLLKIVAERYRDFLLLYTHDDPEFIRRISRLDLSLRPHLKEFYDCVMPKTIKNKFNREEPSLAYIIRHTQLLPREFLMIFDSAIVKSHKMKGTWRYIESRAIVEAVETQEPELADQILSPYEAIYPNLIEACRRVLPELPPICTNSDLDRIGARLKRLSGHETDDPWDTLFKIGVIGYVDDQENRSGNLTYEYGSFHFNSTGPITFALNRRYCVHPVFSGTWKLKRHQQATKFIYPANIEDFP